MQDWEFYKKFSKKIEKAKQCTEDIKAMHGIDMKEELYNKIYEELKKK